MVALARARVATDGLSQRLAPCAPCCQSPKRPAPKPPIPRGETAVSRLGKKPP